jgi:hypothetical protein
LAPRPVLLLLLLLPLALHPLPVLLLPVLPLLFLLGLLRPSSWPAVLSSSWGCGARLRAARAALRGAIEVKPLVQAE